MLGEYRTVSAQSAVAFILYLTLLSSRAEVSRKIHNEPKR